MTRVRNEKWEEDGIVYYRLHRGICAVEVAVPVILVMASREVVAKRLRRARASLAHLQRMQRADRVDPIGPVQCPQG